MELCGPAVPDLSPGAGVGPGAAVLQLTAHGGLLADHAKDSSWGSDGEPGSCQPGDDHGLWFLPVYLPRALGLQATVTRADE